jgi:pyruvate/2-oxoglutarate dehydrogenase complex dihydrolipoamide acyltransferase (E2) component
MATDIVIPNVGESVTSGVIAAWRKKSGERVERDDVVLDLETDKITMEVRAPAAGVLKTLAKEGDTVDIGAVVGSIDESAAAATPAKAPPETPKATKTDKGAKMGAPAPSTTDEGDVRATPLAKKLAEERGVELAKVRGTGPGGRVREQDVMDFAKGGAIARPPAAPGPAPRPRRTSPPSMPSPRSAPATARSAARGCRPCASAWPCAWSRPSTPRRC